MGKCQVGFSGEYIHDYFLNCRVLTTIPERAAVIWVQMELRSVQCNKRIPYYDQFGNLQDWTNKQFFIVQEDREGYVCLYRYDGQTMVYVIPY